MPAKNPRISANVGTPMMTAYYAGVARRVRAGRPGRDVPCAIGAGRIHGVQRRIMVRVIDEFAAAAEEAEVSMRSTGLRQRHCACACWSSHHTNCRMGKSAPALVIAVGQKSGSYHDGCIVPVSSAGASERRQGGGLGIRARGLALRGWKPSGHASASISWILPAGAWDRSTSFHLVG